jgi:hypothetical protein
MKITQITGWRLHYHVSRTMGGSTSTENRSLLHPECLASVFLYPNRVSLKEVSKCLSRMTGNCHVRFLEGRASAIGSGYSIFWDAVERERRESRGCTGTAAPCESESHLRRLHAGSRSTEARGNRPA